MTPAQIERIALIAEEAAEVVHMCMKILRHGPDSYHPDDQAQIPNTHLLSRELGEMQWAIRQSVKAGDILVKEIEVGDALAAANKPRYLHYQD